MNIDLHHISQHIAKRTRYDCRRVEQQVERRVCWASRLLLEKVSRRWGRIVCPNSWFVDAILNDTVSVQDILALDKRRIKAVFHCTSNCCRLNLESSATGRKVSDRIVGNFKLTIQHVQVCQADGQDEKGPQTNGRTRNECVDKFDRVEHECSRV